jgi:hypothetical protein
MLINDVYATMIFTTAIYLHHFQQLNLEFQDHKVSILMKPNLFLLEKYCQINILSILYFIKGKVLFKYLISNSIHIL